MYEIYFRLYDAFDIHVVQVHGLYPARETWIALAAKFEMLSTRP